MTGIYAILNIQNGMMYIGRAWSIHSRRLDHWRTLRKGLHHNTALQSDWNLYGEESFCFMILAICEIHPICQQRIKHWLSRTEYYWIRILVDRLYNSDNVAQSLRGKETPTCAARMVNSRKSRLT